MGISKYLHKLDRKLIRMLREHRQGKRRDHEVRIIIRYGNGRLHNQHESLKRHLHPQKLRHSRHLPLIRAAAAGVKLSALSNIARHPAVLGVHEDRKRKAVLNIATPAVGAAAAARKGWNGKGIGIAVLDTGVYPHPDLTRPKNRIIAFRDFVNGKNRPYDDNGHGTHVAGDAAGNGFSLRGRYRGPAPKANIIGVKILDESGSGYDSQIIRGIAWCLANRRRFGIRILNLSLGGKAVNSWRKEPLCLAVNRAVRAGLIAVVAAGNDGPDAGSIESPGITPAAITVGASDDRRTVGGGDDRVAAYSSRGPVQSGGKPDVLAPGTRITSLRAPNSRLDRLLPGNRAGRWYFVLSGTSMATPMTAGACAQVVQRYPGLTPAGVKRLLQRKAKSLGVGKTLQGAGVINVRFLNG